MKKKTNVWKSLFALVFVATFVLSNVATTFAQAKISALNQELIEKGYPQQLIMNLSEEEKSELKNCTFLGASVQRYTDSGKSYKMNYTPDSTPPALRGGIKDTTFELLVSASRDADGNIRVSMRYEWFRVPYNRYEDLVSFSWNGALFLIDAHTFDSVDFYDTKKETFIINNVSNNFAKLSFNGGSYYANLKWGLGVKRLHGAANFTLEPTSPSGESQLFVSYCHRKTLVKLSASIPNFGSITIDQGASNYDERATNVKFNW